MPTGIATSWAASSGWVHAPVAMTTMSASTGPASVSTPDDPVAGPGQRGHGDALADVGALGPRAGGEGGDDGRRVDLGVVGAEAGAEHVGADRTDLAADLGAVDELHVQAVVAAAGRRTPRTPAPAPGVVK